jgi:dimethylamine monooxygenase subunit A
MPALPSLGFITAPFAMRPGLARLLEDEKHLASGISSAVDEKLAALAHTHSDVLLCMPSFDPLPALRALAQTAAQEYPRHFQLNAKSFSAVSMGVFYDFALEKLMDTAPSILNIAQLPAALRHGWQGLAATLALALEEDFAVVHGPTRSLAMLGVALPSHWVPAEKIGQNFHAAHAPVADNQLLLAAGDGLMQLATSGGRWQRHVWVVTPSARRDAHPKRHARLPWPTEDALLQACYLRVERQTFIPVPGLPQAVFTIHVSTHRLVDICAQPDNATRLRDALSTQSDAVLAYRSMPPHIRDAPVTQLSRMA